MSVLYQKYRPAKFSEVVGQSHIIQTLKNALKNDQVGHAYIFCGSRGTGKTTVARILAKAVNCKDLQDGDVCLKCDACTFGVNLDLSEIDAASYTGVDNIREIIEQSRLLPSVGKRRVYIIDEVHMLSKAAFNALLKTLEEPPSHVLFILATTEIGKVPATVLSRSQRFDFWLHSQEAVLSQLENVLKAEGGSLDKDVLQVVAKASGGGLRDALTLLGQVMALGKGIDAEQAARFLGLPSRNTTMNLLNLIVLGQSSGVVSLFDTLEQDAVDFKAMTADVLEVLRECIECVFSGKAQSLDAQISLQDLSFVVRLFMRAYKEIPTSPEASLPVFLSAVEATVKFSPEECLSIDKKIVSGRGGAGEVLPENAKSKVPSENNLENNLPVNMPPAVKVVESVVESPENISTSSDSVVEEVEVENISNLGLDGLKLLWPSVCEAVREKNGPFGALLKQVRILDFAQGKIYVCVRYDFHKKQFEQPKYAQFLREALLAEGTRISGVDVTVDKEMELEMGTVDESLSSVMQVFGGEVLE